jgi:excisionase family DNA binding protein
MNEPREKAETPELLKPTMYRLIQRGVVPAVREGDGGTSPVRVPASELDAWLYKPEEAA